MTTTQIFPKVRFVLLVAITAVAACSRGGNANTDSTAARAMATTTPAMRDSTLHPADSMSKMASMPGMANMTGDADHDFLRMMSDHHKGLILMAHETIESKDKLGVKPIAKRLDNAQDAELDKMSTMLEKDFKDPYEPKVTSSNQMMADELKGKTGAAYDQTFLKNVIAHHEEAIKIIDGYLPKSKNATVKSMAEAMKAMQSKEIVEFRAKLK